MYIVFQTEYDAIAQNCRNFAVELLDLCRSTEEIEVLLNVREGVDDVNACPENVAFQRVITAVSYEQKEVSALL